jgi:hypothetical protein
VIAFATVMYMIISGLTLCEIHQSSYQTQQMIHETQRLANTSERQWHDTTRPWVSLEDPPEVSPKDNVLLEFSDGIPHANIKFTARNGGGSPAFQFIVNAHLITHPITGTERIGQNMYIRECEAWKTLNDLALSKGQTILSQKDKEMTLPIMGRDRDSDEPGLPQDDPSEIYLIGCVAYNDSTGTPTENRPKVPTEYKDAPKYYTIFYEQFVRADGEQRIPHTGQVAGKFKPVFTSSYQ